MQLDTLVVELLMKNAEFLAQTKKVENALNGLKSVATGVGGALAAMFVKSGITQFTEKAAELDRLSQSLRDNVEDLQAFGEAIKREGGSVDGFNSTVKKLNDEINAIPLTAGRSPLLMGLVRLGVNFRNLDGSMKKPLDTLKDLSARFSKMSLTRSLALGKKLGLDEPTILLLQKGRKGLDELITKYKDLGVMTEEDVKNGARLNKVFQDYRQIITFLGMRMAGYFLPIAEKISNWFIKGAKWVKENERVFKAAITTTGALITASLIKPILKLVSNPVLMGLAALSAAIVLIVEDFMAWKEGADSLLGPLYEWLSKKIPEAIEKIQNIFGKEFSKTWKQLTGIFKDFVKWIKNLDKEWPNLFIAFEQLKNWFKDLIPEGDLVAKMFDGIRFAIDWLVETIKILFEWFDKLGEKLGKKVAEFVVGEKIEDNPKQRIMPKPNEFADEIPYTAIQQMVQVNDMAPAVASMQTTNRTMNNNDNSKTWRVDTINVSNNFTTPIPQNMQQGVANGFNSSVLQSDRWE